MTEQDNLLLLGHSSPVAGRLDERSLDASALNSLLYFSDVKWSDGIWRRCSENARDRLMAAGTRDDVDAASSGNILHHTDVPAQVESGGVDNGPDPWWSPGPWAPSDHGSA